MTEQQEEQKPHTVEVSARAIGRQIWCDLQVEDINALAKVLGMPPVSTEGEEIERRDSEKRRDEIDHLTQLFAHQAKYVAVAISIEQCKKVVAKNEGTNLEELYQALYNQNFNAALSGLYAGVSTLMANGIITWATKKDDSDGE